MRSFVLSEAHALLLQAAFGRGPAAIQAYRSWSRALDFDKLDVAAQRVLPLLVANPDLRAAVPSDDEVMRRCAKVTRFTWLKSRLLMAETAPVVAALGEADIPVLALKGAAVVAHMGGRLADRPMDDVDLAVPAPTAARALAVASAHGFVPEGRVPDGCELASWLRYDHGLELRNERGAAIDLHWHVCGLQLCDETDERFWRQSVPGSVGGAECALTSLSHTIVLVLAHAMAGPAVSLRWATDTVALLRSPAGPAVQWDEVVELARRMDIGVGVGCAFRALVRILDLEIPPAVHRLRRTPSGPQQIERRQASRSSRLSRRPSRAEVINAAYLEHARRTATGGVAGGVGFLSSWCAVDRSPALARRVIRRVSGGRLSRLDDDRHRPFPPLAEGQEVRFDLGGDGHEHLGLGWSQPEGHGTWSTGREATFGADLPWRSDGAVTVSLCFVPFLPPLRPHVGVVLSVGGSDVDRWDLFGPGWLPATRAVTVPDALLASGLRGRFRFDYPVAPDAVGPSAGARALSIAMFSLRVDRA